MRLLRNADVGTDLSEWTTLLLGTMSPQDTNEEVRNVLVTILDAVFIDTKAIQSVIAIKPKPPFKPVFQVAASRKRSRINIINEPLKGSSLFVVETGEGWSLPETQAFYLLNLIGVSIYKS